MRVLALAVIMALGACATPLPQIVPGEAGAFAVRYNGDVTSVADADARAGAHCGGAATYQSQETRYDGLQYRTYRCGPQAALPNTVSVALGPESEARAARACGSDVRPETISHESDVIIYRCLRGVS